MDAFHPSNGWHADDDIYAGPRVGIVGAGIGGLQMARALQKRGIPFQVFEAADEIGGVWRTPLHEQGAQVPWEFYELPELPYPAHIRERFKHKQCPPAEAIQEYLRIYVEDFGLEEYICLNSRVTSLDRPEGRAEGWVATIDGLGGNFCTFFDYIALATGAFNVPYYPDIKDKELYRGKAILARELSTDNLDLAKGKQVVVIGSAKTALDAAGAAAEVADSVTMLCRRAHYHNPFTLFGPPFSHLVPPFTHVVFSRFGVWLAFHPYPTPRGWAARAFHTATFPLRKAFYAMAGYIIPRRLGLPKEMYPEQSLYEDSYGEVGTLVSDNLFLKNLHAGKIIVLRGEADAFKEEGITLKDGRSVPTNFTIYATGFQRSYELLGKELANIHACEEGLPLYRDCIPPDVQGLVFLSEAYSLNAACSLGLISEWVAGLLQGQFQLPSRKEQWADIDRKRAWRRSFMPKNNFRDGRLGNFQIKFYDELLGDLGFPAHRKGWLRDFWQPYASADYAEVFQPRKKKAATVKGAKVLETNGTCIVAGFN